MSKRRTIRKPGAGKLPLGVRVESGPGVREKARGVRDALEARGERDRAVAEVAGSAQAEAAEIQRLAQLARGGGAEAELAREGLEGRFERFGEAVEADAERVREVLDERVGEGGPRRNPFSGRVEGAEGAAGEPGVEGQELGVRFGREGYAPGDAIDGVVVAPERRRARGLEIELGYVEDTPDYTDLIVEDASEHRGSVEAGAELPFTLRLPSGSPPNWIEPPGRIYWALAVRVKVRMGKDVFELHRVPLSEDPAAWRGSAPTGEVSSEARATRGMDLDLAPDRRALSRGEEIAASVSIGKPSPDRSGLRAGIQCRVHYDVEERSSDGSRTRLTRVGVASEEWTALDPATPTQQVRFRVPEAVPFSYGKPKGRGVGGAGRALWRKGSTVAYEWLLIAEDVRRLRRDRRIELPIQVAP